ncbi:MAG: serine--tRNA ligase [Pontimonas sp.]
MIDPALLRDNPEVIRQSLRARGGDLGVVDRAIAADESRRVAITEFETLRGEQNLFGKKVAQAQGEEKSALVAQAKALADRVKAAQATLQGAEAHAKEALYALPNLVVAGVPSGGEENFQTLKTVGRKPSFDYPVRDHLDLAEALGIIDMDRGAKVSGSRFYFLVGAGALLENALMQRAIQVAVANGFELMVPPTLVRPEVMAGTGFLGEHSSEVYYLPHDELYLTGTSEVALAGYHSNEIIDVSAGPKRYAGLSTCYRREAGSHGRDVRGIIRVHQFQKLEMFSYTSQSDAEAEHERLLGWQEQLMVELGLHYRVIDVAAGDLGSSAARKYDIEAWIASQEDFRELTSTSNCTTFQARRLGTRHRVEPDGNTEPVATLNGTLATTRWIVALLETHQQPDGSIRVPDSLQPFVGHDVIRAKGDQ